MPKTSAPQDASTEHGFTLGELMVCAAAREIKDNEIVFVGMRLPLIAFVVAKQTHSPNAVGLFENGVIRSTPARELIYTMADPPNIQGATQCLDMMAVMGLLQSGRVDLGFLGAAEVDRFGNLNSTVVSGSSNVTDRRSSAVERNKVSGHEFTRAVTAPLDSRASAPAIPAPPSSRADDRRPKTEDPVVRLPGSGGACDIASLAQRFVVLLEHSKHRLPERVSYITSPGNGDGGNWRTKVGLPRGGPSAVITTKCVLRFGDDGEAFLSSVHPGISSEDVIANTGWKLRAAGELTETLPPNGAELQAIRHYDREGFWTGK